MATMNQTMPGLSPAASLLGLGDLLKQQVDDAEKERQKKLASTQVAQTSIFGASGEALLGAKGTGNGY